ncbi:MAG: hypothetical protein R2857_06755 [Vampirovibrionales bacterium]
MIQNALDEAYMAGAMERPTARTEQDDDGRFLPVRHGWTSSLAS